MVHKPRFNPLDIIAAVLLATVFVAGSSLYASSVQQAAIAADLEMAASEPSAFFAEPDVVAEEVEADAEDQPQVAEAEAKPEAVAEAEAIAPLASVEPVKAAEKAEPAIRFQTRIVRTDLNFEHAQAYYNGNAQVHNASYEPPQTEIAPAPKAPAQVAPSPVAKAPVHKEAKPVQVAEKPFDQMTIEEKNALSEKLGGKICPGVKGRPWWATQGMINAWLGSMKNVDELKASIKNHCAQAVTAIKTGVNPFM